MCKHVCVWSWRINSRLVLRLVVGVLANDTDTVTDAPAEALDHLCKLSGGRHCIELHSRRRLCQHKHRESPAFGLRFHHRRALCGALCGDAFSAALLNPFFVDSRLFFDLHAQQPRQLK